MTFNKKNKLYAALIVIFVSLITVKAIDLVVGFYSTSGKDTKPLSKPRSIVLRETPPNTDTTVSPYGNYMQDTENLEFKRYRLRTDQNGFIVGPKDFSEKIKQKRVDIVFFGGSTTESLFVNEEIRFPYLVSEMLLDKDGEPLRVLNGGLSGNNTMHSLFAFQAKGIPLGAKFVVLMHAVNDLSALSKSLTYWETASGRDLVRDHIYENVDMYQDKSYLYKIFQKMKDFFVPNIWLKIRHLIAHRLDANLSVDEWSKFRNKSFPSKDIEAALRTQYKAALVTFVRVARIWGSEPVLMTQFNRIRKDDIFVRGVFEKNNQPVSFDEFVRLYAIANDIIREVAAKESVLLIDLDKAIKPTSKFLYDAVHLNEEGSREVADVISRALAQNSSQLRLK
jgi:hypothetical protein